MMGFLGALFLVLLVLKLVGIIAWSWWIIFIPIFAYILLQVLLFLFAILVSIFS